MPLLGGMRLNGLHDLLLDGLQVERGGLLHRREFDEGRAELCHLLLDEHETPELIHAILLGWHSGKFNWSTALYFLAPTGDYSRRQLANTSLNHWAVMPQIAATYFDPATGWQASGMAVYSMSWENPVTQYDTGDILNLEGSVTKNFGRLGVGAVGYGMIQTTADSGAGAKLGASSRRFLGPDPF